jgi:hypothetical protein
VLAHLREALDHHERLEVAELEGDLLKAVVARAQEKALPLYGKLVIVNCELRKANWRTWNRLFLDVEVPLYAGMKNKDQPRQQSGQRTKAAAHEHIQTSKD